MSAPPLVLAARDPAEANGLMRGALIVVEPIHWLWYGRLAFGKPQGLVGMPDQGKDVIELDIAARLSRGTGMPNGEPGLKEPRPTYYLSAEDGFADTVLPRFLAADGDRRYLFSRKLVKKDFLALDQHLDVVVRDLRQIVHELRSGPGLVIISPFDAYLSRAVNQWSSGDVRRALMPIAEALDQEGWALSAIAHLTKDPTKSLLHRVANSQAFAAALRIAYLVGPNPSNPHSRVFVPMKRNLLPPEVKGLALHHDSVGTPGVTQDAWQTVPLAVWDGEIDLSAEEVLAGKQGLTKMESAAVWVIERLNDHRAQQTGVPSDMLKTESTAAGHSWETIKKALRKIGAKNHQLKDGKGKVAGTVWWWPERGVP